MQQALTQGVHHVGLTVDNLEATVLFFTDILGFKRIGGQPDYPSVFVSDGHTMLTFWQLKTSPGKPFDRHSQVGLHHLALQLSPQSSLDQVYLHLQNTPDVSFEFSPEPLGQSGLRHLICQIPGGLRLELVSHAA